MVNRESISCIRLNELSNSDAADCLFESVARWLQDESNNNVSLNGTPEQIAVVKEAILASQKFQNELSNSETTLDRVMKTLEAKHEAAGKFQKMFGIEWHF